MKLIKTAAFLASVSLPCMAPLVAQTPPEQQAAANEEPAQAAAGGLADIVVTARRVKENVQNTPVAVTVLTSSALDRALVTGTEGLSALTPSLQIAGAAPNTGNPSAAQVFIRGIGQTDATPGVDPGVGIYIDDVYQGSALGGIMDFQDISNVQVLRGPQGTLFGRNTIGGAILLTTTQPGKDFGGEVRAGIGSDNLRELRGAIDVPVSPELLTRWTFGSRTRDGYVTRVSDGLKLADVNSYTITGKVQWRPSDSFKLSFKADLTKEHQNGTALVFGGINTTAAFVTNQSFLAGCPGMAGPDSPVPNINDPRCANNFFNLGPHKTAGTWPVASKLKNWGIMGAAEFNASDSLTFKAISSYRELDWSGGRDADNTPLAISHSNADSHGWQMSQELQGIFHIKDFTVVSGLYYFKSKTALIFITDLGYGPLGGGFDHFDETNDNKNWAAFSQATLNLFDHLQLTAGIRYTDETKGMFPNQYNVPFYDMPYIPRRRYEVKSQATTGTGAVQYRWNNDIMTYVSWTRGYKAGGLNWSYFGTPVAAATSFQPEFATAWEVGTKLDLLSRTLRLNLAAFSTNYDDLQLLYRVGIIPTLINAGKARIRGLEGELTYAPDRHWLFNGNFSYLDDRILEVDPVPGSTTSVTTANQLPYVPEWQGQFSAQYTLPLSHDFELSLRGSASYLASQFFDPANALGQTKGVTMFDAGLTLDNSRLGLTIQAGVKNITDRIYAVAGNGAFNTTGGYNEIAYNRGREWTLTVTKKF